MRTPQQLACSLGFVLTLLFASSSIAHADPLQITGGSGTFTRNQQATAFITGDNFSFNVDLNVRISPGETRLGETGSIGVFAAGSDVAGFGPATFNSTSYPALFVDGGAGSYILNYFVPTGSTAQQITVASAFVFSARGLTGCATNRTAFRLCDSPPVFSRLDFVGGGTALLDLIRSIDAPDGTPQYIVRSATFTFHPIPEPATLILLGTGLAGVARTVRRRRKSLRS